MMIGVDDVAKYLSVSQEIVYRWIAKKEIPVYKINELYRFNKVELMEWASSKKMNVSYKIFNEEESESQTFSIHDVVSYGGIYYHVSGKTKDDVLNSIVNLMNLPDRIDRDFLFEALIARENMGTTAIGDGFAIPHVRKPIILNLDRPIISLCFLDEPIDFGALDGKPVNTIITILSNSIKNHLSILSKLMFLLKNEEIKKVINPSHGREEILDAIIKFESTLRK